MAEPTVEDAVALLRDPAYRTMRGMSSDVPHGFAEVSGDRVLSELQVRGATPEEALTLASSALEKVNGLDRSYWRESRSLGGGSWGRSRQPVHVFLVPIEP